MVLVITASGVFGEIRSALNAVWKTSPEGIALASFLRARLLSLALVIGLGALLLCSMPATAFVALWRVGETEGSPLFAATANFLPGFVLISMIFAAIYKLLPDTNLEWGVVGTAALYDLSQLHFGVYLHGAGASAAYSATGGLIVVLLWIYHSAQVFLLGAEFRKFYAMRQALKQRAQRKIPDYGD